MGVCTIRLGESVQYRTYKLQCVHVNHRSRRAEGYRAQRYKVCVFAQNLKSPLCVRLIDIYVHISRFLVTHPDPTLTLACDSTEYIYTSKRGLLNYGLCDGGVGCRPCSRGGGTQSSSDEKTVFFYTQKIYVLCTSCTES